MQLMRPIGHLTFYLASLYRGCRLSAFLAPGEVSSVNSMAVRRPDMWHRPCGAGASATSCWCQEISPPRRLCPLDGNDWPSAAGRNTVPMIDDVQKCAQSTVVWSSVGKSSTFVCPAPRAQAARGLVGIGMILARLVAPPPPNSGILIVT